MKEVEVKILEVNREEVEKKLLDLGAKKIFEGELYGLIYDDKEHSLNKQKNTLRLRKEGNKSILTYKEFISDDEAKSRIEHNIEINDFETTKKVLELLKFDIKSSLKKRRISYKIDNVQIDFDKYLGEESYVPEFLEIESDNIETIFEFAKKLGFKKEDCKPWSGKDLANYYSKNN
jgi:adenylate cyclase class 2